jgi:hypothetical protein
MDIRAMSLSWVQFYQEGRKERNRVNDYIHQKYVEMVKDIKTLGCFWGTLHTMMKANARMTIAEALGGGEFRECRMDGCHLPFQSMTAVRYHFAKSHAGDIQAGWEASVWRMEQGWVDFEEHEHEHDQRELGCGHQD